MRIAIATLFLMVFSLPISARSFELEHALPAGILYPMFNGAAVENPASLPFQKNGRSFQAIYYPPSDSEALHQYGLNAAASKKEFGIGLGYRGSKSSGKMIHGGFFGGGLTINKIALGANLVQENFDEGLDPSIDLAINIDLKKTLRFGVVLRDVENVARPDVGIGYTRKNKYTLEANIRLPDFSQLNGNDYIISLAAAIYVDRFGYSFKIDYHVEEDTYSNTIAGLLWMGDKVNLVVIFTTPDAWGLGLTVTL